MAVQERLVEYDFIVIGSGFGGSVAALRLAEKGYRVAVIEQGRRWTEANLPASNWNFRAWIWRPALGLRGFFSLRFFRHAVVLHGNAVGGGSITYGNTLLVPPDSVWRQGSWVGLNDWEAVMPTHYATVKRMLGVTPNRRLGPADRHLREMARLVGAEDSFYPTEVAVYFGEEGQAPGMLHADPYFAGEGPARNSCNGCGGCLVGCRYNAKNTLDKNYLYLAERKGAEILAETRVVDVRPLGGRNDGSAGYEVATVSSLPSSACNRISCRGLVFAASSLGTQDLLFRLKDRGSLPHISDALGKGVRTNAESIIGVRFPGSKTNLSEGIAIGSGIYIDEQTHIEAVRYPEGSDALGLLATLMAPGRPGWRRIGRWIAGLFRQFAADPVTTLRFLSPRNFARETIIFLCMQTVEGQLTMRLKRPWFWPFSRRLATIGDRVPAFIPEANDFAIKAAKSTGGIPMTSVSEILLNIPMTAHCMGGAAMGHAPADGVCDAKNRVFGYYNMYICDGSMLGSNLGVNPSLTIAALTEHAMSHVPPAGAQDWMATGTEVQIG